MKINLAIQDLKKKIAMNINESRLPPGVTLMVVNEFVGQLQKLNNEAIELEKQTEAKNEKETQENTK